MVTRHLDGYPLWPTSVTNPHMPPGYWSRRDLVGDLTGAVRAAELIDAYRPSVLWNDVGWPAESDPHRVMAHYYNTVADGVVNDRWTQVRVPANRLVRGLYLRFVTLALKALARSGRSLPQRRPSFHSDLQTHEYATPDPAPTSPWELCRGLGRSFGYNAQETTADTLTGTQLVHLLADVVAHGGNLLINVGPDGAGRIPDLQQRPLHELGAWLDRNGEAIHATRPWSPAATTTTGGQRRPDHATPAATQPPRTGPDDHNLVILAGQVRHTEPSGPVRQPSGYQQNFWPPAQVRRSNPGPWGMGGRGPGLDCGVAPHASAGSEAAGPGGDPDDPTPRWRTVALGAAAAHRRAGLPLHAVVVIGAAPAGVGVPIARDRREPGQRLP
jgi:hypothetical protein